MYACMYDCMYVFTYTQSTASPKVVHFEKSMKLSM